MTMTKAPYDAGKKVFSWTAHDYHPHDRGLVWHVLFVLIFFGGALWAALSDPRWGWVTAACLCVIAGIYLMVHKQGAKDHEVEIFEKGLMIDGRRFIHWDKLTQFWFVYDDTVSVIKFDFVKNPNDPLTLQMGDVTLEKFRAVLSKTNLKEAESKEESVMDLWIRVLKL